MLIHLPPSPITPIHSIPGKPVQERLRQPGSALRHLLRPDRGSAGQVLREGVDVVGPLHHPGGAARGRRRDDTAAVHGPLQGQREAGDHHALARGQHALLILHASRSANYLHMSDFPKTKCLHFALVGWLVTTRHTTP